MVSFVRAPEMFTLIPPSSLLHRRKRSPNTRVSSLVIWKLNALTYQSAVFFGSGDLRWMWLMRKPMGVSLVDGISRGGREAHGASARSARHDAGTRGREPS